MLIHCRCGTAADVVVALCKEIMLVPFPLATSSAFISLLIFHISMCHARLLLRLGQQTRVLSETGADLPQRETRNREPTTKMQ